MTRFTATEAGDPEPATDFKLGDWWVRPQRNELERASETAHIEARSMAVLVSLAKHAPGVVGKELLLQEVWSDSPFVGDDVISHAIWELRKALGDSARQPTYIQTVPRKGYRLVAEVLRPQGSPLPMEGVRIDHYDFHREIGRGAMGVVWEALDRRLERTVAIKFLAPELTRDVKACQRFQREARLAASLEHPNLATVHEVGETSQGHRYLVSAYYRGGSLKDRLSGGPLEVEEALRWMRQLVAGLAAAHRQGIVHRDVKPANLLLDEHGTLKICDFGIAKLLGATDLTRTDSPLGTPAYKSPEQAKGKAVDHRTDLWSAGVVLFELLTGRRPFDGEYEQALVHSILSREPRSLEEARGGPVPASLHRFVGKALTKDPAQRFQSADEMAAALDRLVDGAEPGSRRPRLWRGLVAAAVALAVFGAIWTFRLTQQDPQTSVRSSEGWDHLIQGRKLWIRGNHPANLAEVRRHFERAVELLPESAIANAHLAAFLADRYAASQSEEDRDRSYELIIEALALDYRSSLAKAANAWILLIDGNIARAESLAREAIEIEPQCERGESCDLAYLWLGEALWVQDRHGEALEILDQGIRVGDGHIRCRLKRAQLYEKFGQKREAEEDYLSVLQMDEVQTTALSDLANLYLVVRRADEAMPLLNRLYKTTQDTNVLISMGYELYRRELWAEALEIYAQAHRRYTADGVLVPTPIVAIGDIYLEQGRKEEAQQQYEQALEIFASIEHLGLRRRAQRAACLAKLERFPEAEEEVGDLMQYVGDFPGVLYYAGRISALKGDRETLFDLAQRWIGQGGPPAQFLDDVAFLPFRKDRAYLRILEPELIPEP